MAINGERYMQLIVFFDLPTNTKQDRRHAAIFRKFLLKNGYYMLQYSVYCRICKGEDSIDKQNKRLKKFLPPKGNIRTLKITNLQYSRMELLLGNMKKEEEIGVKQLLLF